MVVLWHCPDGVVAGAHQDAATAVVGSGYQQHLHVVFRPALRGCRRALAAQPKRLGSIRPAVRRIVIRRARRLRGPAVSAAVGCFALHPGRHCRRPVQPTLHVQEPRRCSPRRAAGRDAQKPARCPPVRRADLHSRLGNAASAVGRSAGQLRAGQRKSGRGNSLAACRLDRDDLDLPVAPGQAQVASAAGGLPVGDGLRAGVFRRALRDRHPAGLGARRDGVAGDRSSRLVVVTPPCVEVSCPRPG
jgi:hypothetical protein